MPEISISEISGSRGDCLCHIARNFEVMHRNTIPFHILTRNLQINQLFLFIWKLIFKNLNEFRKLILLPVFL